MGDEGAVREMGLGWPASRLGWRACWEWKGVLIHTIPNKQPCQAVLDKGCWAASAAEGDFPT